ncbi:restriction endonuclease subunit S [Nocardiopsis salina]|uniref:restriction endonuclease subunit S n=1 Tax=Nocardiopsis salina TaxID=245836 RepID=UPI000A01571D|nr:restriction endonuclease subunit S [Nocardiopsis salina]
MSFPTVPLRRLFKVANGGTPTAAEENWGGDVPWATPVDLSGDDIEISTTHRCLTKAGALNGSRIVPAGSILLSTRAPIGYTALAGVPMAFNQGCRALLPTAEVDARFFRYQLEARKEDLQSLGMGTTFVELSSGGLAQVDVSAPEVEGQRRIADFLDLELERLDGVISARELQVEKLGELESSLISESMVPGGVGAPSGKFPWPWLPEDGGAPLVRLGYLCHVQGGVTVDASRAPSPEDVTRPYLRVANVKAGWLELDSVSEIRVPRSVAEGSTLRAGDVLMTEGGDIDKLGRGTMWNGELPGALHQNHVFVLRVDADRLDPQYLTLLTRSSHGRCYFEATGVKSTNLASTSSSKVRSFPVPLISLTEQKKVVAYVNSALEQVEELRVSLGRQIELLKERKRALITAAVTGQIDVTTARGADVS